MTMGNKLSGRRIAALVADGFEQIELTAPLKALRAAGASVDVISLRPGKILGMHLSRPGKSIKVDRTLADAGPSDYDGLFIPGGFISPDLLRQSREARSFVSAFDAVRKPIAIICHGAWLLASADLLKDRLITSWPGIRDDLVHAGAVWLDESVVRDGNWVSSRGPQDLGPFMAAMIDLFAQPESAAAAAPSTTQLVSSPQHDAPPSFAVGGAALVPRLARAGRYLGAAAALGAGALFAVRRWA